MRLLLPRALGWSIFLRETTARGNMKHKRRARFMAILVNLQELQLDSQCLVRSCCSHFFSAMFVLSVSLETRHTLSNSKRSNQNQADVTIKSTNAKEQNRPSFAFRYDIISLQDGRRGRLASRSVRSRLARYYHHRKRFIESRPSNMGAYHSLETPRLRVVAVCQRYLFGRHLLSPPSQRGGGFVHSR